MHFLLIVGLVVVALAVGVIFAVKIKAAVVSLEAKLEVRLKALEAQIAKKL